jgi:hypothetical protein
MMLCLKLVCVGLLAVAAVAAVAEDDVAAPAAESVTESVPLLTPEQFPAFEGETVFLDTFQDYDVEASVSRCVREKLLLLWHCAPYPLLFPSHHLSAGY